MNKYEDPIQFCIKKILNNISVEYSNLMEISQGGPVVGNLTINDKAIKGRYGGPLILKDNYIYIPIYVNKFIGTGFRLSRINLSNLEVSYLSKVKDLIFLEKIEDNKIYFYEDISKTIKGFTDLL
jgi:hypothetical protein